MQKVKNLANATFGIFKFNYGHINLISQKKTPLENVFQSV